MRPPPSADRDIAQPDERRPPKAKDTGSSPVVTTNERVNQEGCLAPSWKRMVPQGMGFPLSATMEGQPGGLPGSVRSGCVPQGMAIETSAFRHFAQARMSCCAAVEIEARHH